MKKKLSLFLGILSACAIALGGCAGGEQAKTERPQFSVSQSALYCDFGGYVTLPAASAGEGISIKVTVWDDDEKIAEYDGSKVNNFTPPKAGDYKVRYQALDSEGVLSDIKEVALSVFETPAYRVGNPVIEVSEQEIIYSNKDSVVLRSAKGEKSDGSDISHLIKVEVYDDVNACVFSGNGGQENSLTNLPCGTYSVTYTLEADGNSAAAKTYYFAIVSVDGIKPVLDAPISAKNVWLGKSIQISSANAEDIIDGDISDKVMVRIEGANGDTVLSKRSAALPFTHTFEAAGEYRVIYSVENNRGTAGDELGYKVVVTAPETSQAISIDGVINESLYAQIPEYRFGMGGNVNYYFHADDEYLYIAADVKDENLVKNNSSDPETALNNSDGLEFMFNPEDTSKLYITNSKCFRVRVGVDGRTKTYMANSNNDQWVQANIDLTGNVAVTAHGTTSVWGQTSATDEEASDKDIGYSVELRLPWSAFGYSAKPWEDNNYGKDYIRMGFGHRDVKSPQCKNQFKQINAAIDGGENNCFYNGMNYIDRPKVASEGLNPSMYSALYLNGENLGVNPVVCSGEVVLDGFMEQSFWHDAIDVPYGTTSAGSEVTCKAKCSVEGIYMGVYIKDADIVAEARGFLGNYGIFCNDCIDLRIVPEGEGNSNSLVTPVKEQTCITDGKVFAFDPLGSAYMQMLQPVGASRAHAQLPFLYGVMADGTVGSSSDGSKWTSGNIFIADENTDDKDNGWGVELFVPWSTLNMASPVSGESVKLHILLATYDRGANPAGASWKYSIIDPNGSARSTPNMPNTYFVLETTV